jgi:thiol-disulfide isomerase/thioredoxin
MTIRDFESGTIRAHELYGDYWFNSDPVPVLAQRGYVVLLDFWDYTSSACLHSIPYVIDWHRKYAPQGLVVLGVHTPRFPFGKEPENVQRAIHQLGIPYPVVMDNEAMVWSRYGNRVWPAQHIVDRNGFVRFVNAGGGSPGATEHELQTLMLDAGLLNDFPDLTEPIRETDRPGAVCYRATPEIFAGYLRGSMGNIEGYTPESAIHYTDPGIYVEGKFYVAGDWSNDREDLRLVGEGGGEVLVRYSALEMDAVLSVLNGSAIELEVLQDGEYLAPDMFGKDVRRDEKGRSIVTVREPRSYDLLHNREHGEHLLRLVAPRGGVTLYALCFTPGAIPVLISR